MKSHQLQPETWDHQQHGAKKPRKLNIEDKNSNKIQKTNLLKTSELPGAIFDCNDVVDREFRMESLHEYGCYYYGMVMGIIMIIRIITIVMIVAVITIIKPEQWK